MGLTISEDALLVDLNRDKYLFYLYSAAPFFAALVMAYIARMMINMARDSHRADAEFDKKFQANRQAALATLSDGRPSVSMVACVPESGFDGFLLHLSDLAAHKRHLRADPRCSLLVFEPDDPRVEVLMRKRVSLDCTAAVIDKASPPR